MASQRIPLLNDQDRISRIPDRILHHILSRPPLTILDAVAVSGLSRRWRDLWKSMPHLFFDVFKFRYTEDDPEAFGRYVDTVLLLRNKSDFRSFRLRWYSDHDSHGQYHLNTWARHAVKRNVKVLDFNINADQKQLELPRCIFECETLEELRLWFVNCVNLNPPKLVGLTRLKELHLDRMIIDDEALERLILGCPVLETLTLVACWLTSLVISSDSLKDLVIQRCAIRGTEVRVSCPNLVSFRFMVNYAGVVQVLFEPLSSLVNASVVLDDIFRYKYGGSALSFLEGFQMLKLLSYLVGQLRVSQKKNYRNFPYFTTLRDCH